MRFTEFLDRHLKWLLVGLAVALLAFAVLSVVSSLPPREFTILTGREGGAYYQFAQEYQRLAAEKGFTINIQPTAGSVETLRMLEDGEAGIGFVQGGIGLEGDASKLNTMASVFYEPLWFFYRKELNQGEPFDNLIDLEGARLSIGEPGSGTNKLMKTFFADLGIDPEFYQLVELSTQQARDGLLDGSLDAAVFVASASSSLVRELALHPDIELVSPKNIGAFLAHYPYLTSLTLPAGAFEMSVERLVPDRDIELLATVANLVVREDFHPDLLRLMILAVVQTHEQGGLLEKRYEFPNFLYADLPVSREEIAYTEQIKKGESVLDNYLPFWAAALIDRYLLFVVPIALLVLPLLGRSPLLYIWYNRHKVNRWYRTLHAIEVSIDQMSPQEIDVQIERLDELDDRLAKLELSVGYMAEAYELRTHMDHVIGRLERHRKLLEQEQEQAAMASASQVGS